MSTSSIRSDGFNTKIVKPFFLQQTTTHDDCAYFLVEHIKGRGTTTPIREENTIVQSQGLNKVHERRGQVLPRRDQLAIQAGES